MGVFSVSVAETTVWNVLCASPKAIRNLTKFTAQLF